MNQRNRMMKSIATRIFTVALAVAAATAEPAGTNQFGPVSDSDLHISGVIMADDGQSVAGAKFQFKGFINTSDGAQYGGQPGRFVQEPVVSDARGRFQLRCKSNVELIHAVVSAPGEAPRPMQFRPGRDYVIRLQSGVRVTGRLLAAGGPVSGAEVRAEPAIRAKGLFVTDPSITDGNGGFTISHLPPEQELVLFATMDSMKGRGALPPRSFTSGKNQTTYDLGDLVLQPSFSVAGRILLTEGKPVPTGASLLLARQEVADTTWYTLKEDGHFEFTSVPAGSVTVGERLVGYHFSRRNPSLDWLNNQIVGRLDHDLTNLTLELEPGEFQYMPNHDDAPTGTDLQPRDKPLRGVP